MPRKWYWWRSQFSRLKSNGVKLKMSTIFDFATSTESGQQPFGGGKFLQVSDVIAALPFAFSNRGKSFVSRFKVFHG
jgi:hypothetical protein